MTVEFQKKNKVYSAEIKHKARAMLKEGKKYHEIKKKLDEEYSENINPSTIGYWRMRFKLPKRNKKWSRKSTFITKSMTKGATNGSNYTTVISALNLGVEKEIEFGHFLRARKLLKARTILQTL